MPRLPSSTDVPTISPRVAADPGLTVPKGAFDSPLGIVAEELIPVAQKFEQVKLKQDNRRDTVDRSSKINQFTREADDELSRLNAEEDLSSDEILGKYGKFLTERTGQLLQEHGGSPDSMTKLTVRLQDVGAGATGRAAGISAKIGRDSIKTVFNDAITPLVTNASLNPTQRNLDGLFVQLESQLGDIREALSPVEEEAARQLGREQIVLGAIDPLITRGRVETAEALLVDGGMFQSLSASRQREIRRRLDTVRFNRDKTDNDLSEREKRVIQLTDRGLSLELSQDIAAKDVKIVGPDAFGDFFKMNITDNTKVKVDGADREILSSAVGQQPQQEAPEQPGRTLAEDVQKATGPFSKIQAGISGLIGPFVQGTIFEDTTNARQQVKTFNQIAKTALVNNPKFPVAEQEIVSKLLPDPGAFFTDPDTARTDLNELKSFLKKSKASKEKESATSRVSSKRKAGLADQISRINELLTLMTEPKKVNIQGEEVDVGTIVTNSRGQQGRIEEDGTITVIK